MVLRGKYWRRGIFQNGIGRFIKTTVIIILFAIIGVLMGIFFIDSYSAHIVMSDSMRPTFATGDMVIVGSPGSWLSGDVSPGEIITFEHNKQLVTHRVVAMEGNEIQTKGDAQEEIDPWMVSRIFDVKGIYIFHIPYMGLVSNYIKTKQGWLICVILPAVCLLAFIIKDIVKEVRLRFIYTYIL